MNTPWFNHYEEGVPQTVDVPPMLVQDMLAQTAIVYSRPVY